jgi:SMI1 / KNR4 family (SUKH-1)
VLSEQIATWGTADFRQPATPASIRTAEAKLGAPLPIELRDLFRESDGVKGEYGLDLVWTAERIGEDNALFRSDPEFARLYLPFEGLVFFSDAGNGDQFAVSLRGPQDVYVWNHEDDSRMWVASSVLDFLRRWMTNELTI